MEETGGKGLPLREVRNVNGNATFGVLLDRFEYWECIAIGTLMAV